MRRQMLSKRLNKVPLILVQFQKYCCVYGVGRGKTLFVDGLAKCLKGAFTNTSNIECSLIGCLTLLKKLVIIKKEMLVSCFRYRLFILILIIISKSVKIINRKWSPKRNSRCEWEKTMLYSMRN